MKVVRDQRNVTKDKEGAVAVSGTLTLSLLVSVNDLVLGEYAIRGKGAKDIAHTFTMGCVAAVVGAKLYGQYRGFNPI